MLGKVLRYIYNSLLITTLWGSCFYYPRFIDKETETHRDQLLKITQPANAVNRTTGKILWSYITTRSQSALGTSFAQPLWRDLATTAFEGQGFILFGIGRWKQKKQKNKKTSMPSLQMCSPSQQMKIRKKKQTKKLLFVFHLPLCHFSGWNFPTWMSGWANPNEHSGKR